MFTSAASIRRLSSDTAFSIIPCTEAEWAYVHGELDGKGQIRLALAVELQRRQQGAQKVRDQIEEAIYVLAGGFRFGAAGKGAYRMKNGQKQIDITQEVWIVIDEDDEPALKQLAGEFAALLDQETLYLEKTSSTPEFIPPSPVGGLF